MLALSVSPASYVVDVDLCEDESGDPGRLVVHQLGGTGRLQRMIGR